MKAWLTRMARHRMAVAVGLTAAVVIALATTYLQNDLHRDHLDPKTPFQIYVPPPAPDYAKSDSWDLNPQLAGYFADPRKVDVFFIHGTSFDGGSRWLGGIDANAAEQEVMSVQLPNYAAPFAVTGNIYAPRYRQASLYTQLTLREDAVEARAFAYRDVEVAFQKFLKTRRGGKGFVIVGVEQGGLLAERLVRDIVAPDAALRGQLVAAYMLETLVPASQFSAPAPVSACLSRTQTGCVMAYLSVDNGRLDKALQGAQKAVYWDATGGLSPFSGQTALCVNPVLGMVSDAAVDARHAQGATNATGLEWGTEPAMIARKVASHCSDGFLYVDGPKSPSFRETGTWEDRHKVVPYNLFYGDLEADLAARWQAYEVANGG